MEHLDNFGWPAIEAISSTLAVLITVLVLLSKFHTRMAKLELKIDTIWEFLMKRAMSEAISKRLGSYNSPFAINEQTRPLFDFIKEDLQKYYREEGYKLDDKKLFIEIESRFGKILVDTLCVPNNWVSGACLIAAMAIAKEATILNDPKVDFKIEG